MTETPEKTSEPVTICGVDVKPEVWTWEQAEEALGKNTANRNLRDIEVIKYARLMTEGKWGVEGFKMCPGFIVFDEDGNLADGQHRLKAQARSKTTQAWFVLRGVPPDAQQTIDTNVPRLASDLLKFHGYQHYVTLSSVARWAWILERKVFDSPWIKVSNDEILDMVERHPDLQHSVATAIYVRSGRFVPIHPTPLGAAHWWIAQHNDHLEADWFLERIAHLGNEKTGSPLIAVINRFVNAKAGSRPEYIPTRTQIAMLIKAWNMDVERKSINRMPSKSRSGEFPLEKVYKRRESQEDTFGPLPQRFVEELEFDEEPEENEEGEENQEESA